MGQAREIMDRITDAAVSGDRDALGRLYAADAVAETPDAPRLQGATAIIDYLMAFKTAFPDASWESATSYESGDSAIDEGYIVGTNTGTLGTPDGDVPATGRSLRLRECDMITVADGMVVSHHFYFDQLDFALQLGLVGSDAGAGTGPAAVPEPRGGAARASEATVR
jgi:ketosteroid isomerase-like protein